MTNGQSDSQEAPGRPGSKPTWSPASKSGIGCAISPASRIWFTLGRGIVNEVYHPRIDQAAIRDLGFIVTGPGGFFSEEQADCNFSTTVFADGVPAYRIENTCRDGRFRIVKEIIADPGRSVLLQRVKFEVLKGSRADLRLFFLLNPRLGDQGKDNNGWVGSYRDRPMLFAQYDDHSLAVAASCNWKARSVGFVGVSDAWQDLRRHGEMTWQYGRATHGHIALAGELDLESCDGEFLLAVSFDGQPSAAALNAMLSLNADFQEVRDRYVHSWQQWHEQLEPLDEGEGELAKASEQSNRPDQSRPRVPADVPWEPANLYRTSMMVLRAHRSKQLSGAGVASICVPWGQVRGDDDLGGYHLVWARDLVEECLGLLAGGEFEAVRRSLDYLRATQLTSGGWPQDMWLNGEAYADAVQLDEAALPIVLMSVAHREGALSDGQLEMYWQMMRQAAAFLVRSGPSTGEDRWENTSGISPYTLAAEIAALLIAAEYAERFHQPHVARYFRETADLWHDSLDSWTFATGNALAKQIGVDGYYTRIIPSPGLRTLYRRGPLPLMKAARSQPVDEIVSPDALALVRFGIRSADDPRILSTLKVVDAITRADLPAGPCWRRYNEGYYGEHDDGEPFLSHGDRQGHGRAWPLLTGERGHYDLARGDLDQARRMLQTMGGFTSQIGFMPEQVWDAEDIPERKLFKGRPSGSAMPLAWTHSEYIRLLRSVRDQKVFDLPHEPFKRYASHKPYHTWSNLWLWRFDHLVESFPAGRRLRIEVKEPGLVHYSTDQWRTTRDAHTADSELGLHFVDLPTDRMKPGSQLSFTFRWSKEDRWEGNDFHLQVDPPLQDASASAPDEAAKDSDPQSLVGSHR